MSLRQIDDIRVITNTRAIGRGIIRAEDLKFAKACSRPQCKRNQVWFRIVAFPNLSAFIRTGRVEVAQAGIAQPIRRVVRLQRLFEERFCNPVRIARNSRIFFCDRRRERNAIHGACRGKNKEMFFARVQHCIQHGKPALNIIPVVFARISYGFADEMVGGKIHHGIGLL